MSNLTKSKELCPAKMAALGIEESLSHCSSVMSSAVSVVGAGTRGDFDGRLATEKVATLRKYSSARLPMGGQWKRFSLATRAAIVARQSP